MGGSRSWVRVVNPQSICLYPVHLRSYPVKISVQKGDPILPGGEISCRSSYMAYLEYASYTVVSVGLQDKPEYELDNDASLVNITAPDDMTHSFVVPMDNFVLNSSVMYDISSPFEQMTFWGKPQDNTFKDYFTLSGLPITCAFHISTA